MTPEENYTEEIAQAIMDKCGVSAEQSIIVMGLILRERKDAIHAAYEDAAKVAERSGVPRYHREHIAAAIRARVSAPK